MLVCFEVEYLVRNQTSALPVFMNKPRVKYYLVYCKNSDIIYSFDKQL
jgi:hypothetical protein